MVGVPETRRRVTRALFGTTAARLLKVIDIPCWPSRRPEFEEEDVSLPSR